MRRLWVKRGVNGTPASIQLQGDDLVDDLKDAVFRKYPVALARSYDAPDVSICVALPSSTKPNITETKALAVDTSVDLVVKTYFPSGQRVEDALVIQVPSNSQAHASPYVSGPMRHSPLSGTLGLLTHDMRDFEYFPETPPLTNSTGQSAQQQQAQPGQQYNANMYNPHQSARSLSATSHQRSPGSNNVHEGSVRPAPPLQMSSAMRTAAYRQSPRPSNAGSQTGSQHSIGSRRHSSHNDGDTTPMATTHQPDPQIPPPPPLVLLGAGDDRSVSPSIVPLSTDELSAAGQLQPSQLLEEAAANAAGIDAGNHGSPAPGRMRRDTSASSNEPKSRPPRPSLGRTHTASKLNIVSPAASTHSSTHSVAKVDKSVKLKKEAPAGPGLFGPGGLLEGVVPPIVVLVVEDNMINQKILETFMKKRKIRCLTAKNGREAVDKWKMGGIHLVLMDIQMPIMSGIEATKEIRRLERINNIGVFSKKETVASITDEADLLPAVQLRSPVIIVALTASSLQSDRHEALAAGCNDFLTKPVSLVWLERKVFEWGCMQALIDFEGWKKFRNAAA
ncbi:hypothetical protein BCR37DRAFT_355999 [Protomyces lactucae-debilis]|uniref:Response regulatory domain-containing protein n=1 Tax=Protomyces lactucae-debilis TaxID=2754530 RepID=A0A1Y2FMD2_PROLT|nr:uncharacterized protein BCR37DRAFT_355999 [Protomyces lactucae-debilis]ORY85089.1 hypothetical protein BCR37DRAFT_355999 [Protomyces lactucae-debilis]